MWGPIFHWFMCSLDHNRQWSIHWESASRELSDCAVHGGKACDAISANHEWRLRVQDIPDEEDLENDYIEQRGVFLYSTVEAALQALANSKGKLVCSLTTQVASAFTLHQMMDKSGSMANEDLARAQVEVQLRRLAKHPDYRPWYAAIVSSGQQQHQGETQQVLFIRFFDEDEEYGQIFSVPYQFNRKKLTVLGPAYYRGQEANPMLDIH